MSCWDEVDYIRICCPTRRKATAPISREGMPGTLGAEIQTSRVDITWLLKFDRQALGCKFQRCKHDLRQPNYDILDLDLKHLKLGSTPIG